MQKKRFSFSILLSFLLTVGCTKQVFLPGDSAAEIRKMWEKTLTKCGNDSWTEVFGGWAEYQNFDYTTREMFVSDIDRKLNRVEWRVSTHVKRGVPFRVWNPFWRRWDREWAPSAGDDGNLLSPGSMYIVLEKKNGMVTYNGIIANSYHPAHFNCSVVPST